MTVDSEISQQRNVYISAAARWRWAGSEHRAQGAGSRAPHTAPAARPMLAPYAALQHKLRREIITSRNYDALFYCGKYCNNNKEF